MLSCSWCGNYVYLLARKFEFSMSCFYLKSLVIFIYAHSCHSLVYAKPQLHPWAEENSSEGPRFSDHGRWSRKCWKFIEKLRQRTDVDLQKCKIALLTRTLALRGIPGVTRRDGLSSWRVIFYMPVGMLSCSWGWELSVLFGAKIWILDELFLFQIAGYIFPRPHRWHSLVYAKPQLHPWAEGNHRKA